MKSRLFLPGAFTLASLLILIALGAWQWRRMDEKLALIQTIQSRAALVPQALPSPGTTFEPEALNYTPVTFRGTFVAAEAHVFFSLAKPVNGVGGPGYLVIQPFRLEDGRFVLVNRGFVPADKKNSFVRDRPGEPVTVTGVLRLPERRGPFSGADDPAKNIYYVRDPEAIARGMQLGRITGSRLVEPYTVDLATPVPPGGLPMPGTTQVNIPNNHFQYALTWWSLAVVLAAIFLIYARQERRK